MPSDAWKSEQKRKVLLLSHSLVKSLYETAAQHHWIKT